VLRLTAGYLADFSGVDRLLIAAVSIKARLDAMRHAPRLARPDQVVLRSIESLRPIWAISARARVVRQKAADEALMIAQPMTAPWSAKFYAAGMGPPAGTATKAGLLTFSL
jgi:hypothetical protein